MKRATLAALAALAVPSTTHAAPTLTLKTAKAAAWRYQMATDGVCTFRGTRRIDSRRVLVRFTFVAEVEDGESGHVIAEVDVVDNLLVSRLSNGNLRVTMSD